MGITHAHVGAGQSERGQRETSCLSVHLAVLAEAEKETVGIIDLDPQANVYAWREVRGTNAPNVFPGTADDLPKMIDAAATLGVTLTLIDTPSKVDATVLVAIRAADLIIMPTRAGLFDVAALKDTVKLLVMAEKLPAALAVINNFDPDRTAAVISEASAVLEGFGIAISPLTFPIGRTWRRPSRRAGASRRPTRRASPPTRSARSGPISITSRRPRQQHQRSEEGRRHEPETAATT